MEVSLPAYVTFSDKVLMQDFADEAVLLNLQNKHYYTMNEVGLRCWQLLAEDGSVANAIARLLAEYEVDEFQLKQDVAKLLEKLVEAGLVEVKS